MENIFGIFGKYGKKNQRETVPEVATRVARVPTFTGRAPYPRGPLVRRLTPFFGRKKANFWRKKSRRRFQSNRSYRSPYIYETVKGQPTENAETERDRETDPISEGLSPFPRHGDHGQRGQDLDNFYSKILRCICRGG